MELGTTLFVAFCVILGIGSAADASASRREVVINTLLSRVESPKALSSSAPGTTAELSTPFALPRGLQGSLNQEDIFTKWKQYYGFSFRTSADEATVNTTFTKRLNNLVVHNQRYDRGLETYWMTLNGYSGLKEKDLVLLRTGLDKKRMKNLVEIFRRRTMLAATTTITKPTTTTMRPTTTTTRPTTTTTRPTTTTTRPTTTTTRPTTTTTRPTTTTTRPTTTTTRPTTTTTRPTTTTTRPTTTTTRLTTTTTRPTTTTTRPTTTTTRPTTTTTRPTTTTTRPTTTTTRQTTTTTRATTTTAGSTATTVDYTTSKYYPVVKNQGQCGSCWAFAVVAPMEMQINTLYNITTTNLSEQQLVDCDVTNWGCNGGWPHYVYRNLVTSTFGITTESLYPYTGVGGSCRSAFKRENYKILSQNGIWSGRSDGWGSGTEAQLETLVRSGPVVVALFANDALFYYAGGILNGCPAGSVPNHAVTVVGFGTENGTPYWYIRNSWGTNWGINSGHFKMQKGTMMCSIQYYFTAPTLSKTV